MFLSFVVENGNPENVYIWMEIVVENGNPENVYIWMKSGNPEVEWLEIVSRQP